MGNCCTSSNPTTTPLSSNTGYARTQSTRPLTSINTEKLAERFCEQIKKLKTFRAQLEKKLEAAKSAKLNFCKSLERLDLHFSKKPLSQDRSSLEKFECPSCLVVYNNNLEKPLDLYCGHTICLQCALQSYSSNNYIECPVESIPTHSLPDELKVNSEILEAIEAISNNLFCFAHLLPANNFCITCKMILCVSCLNLHTEHVVSSVSDPETLVEIETWEKELDQYMLKLKTSKETLIEHNDEIGKIETKLKDCVENHVKEININREKVINELIYASMSHIEGMNEIQQRFMESLPLYNLKLYKDSIGQEIERADDALKEFKDLSIGEKLHLVGKNNFKTQYHVPKPDLAPLEESCKYISDIHDFEALILALASESN